MLRERLGKDILFLDGAMGTQLQAAGMQAGQIPESYNIEHPEIILDIHRRYIEAGADLIMTNSFGCNPLKLQKSGYDWQMLLQAGVQLALQAKQEAKKEVAVLLDIGPIGQLLAPLGTLSFDEAYQIISQQVLLVKDQVDGVILETMSDLYEVKAGILAVKENSDLPLFVTMTFDATQRTLTGTDPLTFVNVVESLGVDALGVNCSLGPKELQPIVDTLLQYSSIPVIVSPNAGLPVLQDGQTCYPLDPQSFASYMADFMAQGISVAGGCCGTTPDFIKAISPYRQPVKPRHISIATRISSQYQTLTLGQKPLICGERLNPTGKKRMQKALKEGRYDICIQEAIAQQEAGAMFLDVNVGVPGIDEVKTMTTLIRQLQEILDLPLQIDSSSPQVIAQACRYYNGRPIINSVNGKKEVMDAIFPIAKKYGACVIGLTMADHIPAKAEERLAIAQQIIAYAKQYGIDKKDIVIDCLTLTASCQQAEVKETLKAIRLIKQTLQVPVVLGVSNVSFGLPDRSLLNQTFLAMALNQGLDIAIINPLDQHLVDTFDAAGVLAGWDQDSLDYLAKHLPQNNSTPLHQPQDYSLQEIIQRGLKEQIGSKTRSLLKQYAPLDIIQNMIIPALNQVGEDYEAHRLFLPQLMMAAETTKIAFDILKSQFQTQSTIKGPVMICTVEGDIHDIGKNIVKVVIESYGYQVIDLGKDVRIQDVVSAWQTHHPKAIGLSALMTTTLKNMEKTIQALHQAGCNCPIWVGGAVLTPEIAKDIGADYYTEDAMASVRLLKQIIP